MWQKRINHRVHPVWCLTWFCGGVLGGIAAVGLLDFRIVQGLPAILIAVCLLLISCIGRRSVWLPVALLAGLLCGLARGGAEQQALKAYEPFYGKSVLLVGVVNDDVSYGSQGTQQVRVRDVRIDRTELSGVVWVTLPDKSDMKRGDIVGLSGLLIKGFGNFPASLVRPTVSFVERPYPGDIARRIRDWFAEGIRRAIPEPEASLGIGYLIGQRSALPDTLNEQLRMVGLTHAVVASGYNLTILVGFARRLFVKHSKYLATLAAGGMIVCFVLITGFSPSMTRAGLVSMLSLGAWYYGRAVHPVVLLTFAAAVTAMWRPSYVWGDIGWYLSFTAFAGVIILAPLIRQYFFGKGARLGLFGETLLETTSAQLLTMPIILFSFGQYASYALLANMLVLPFVPLAMLLTFIAGIGGLVAPSLAHVIGFPATTVLATNIFTIEWVAGLPGSGGDIIFGLAALVVSYLVLLIIMIYLWKVTQFNFRKQREEQITVF